MPGHDATSTYAWAVEAFLAVPFVLVGLSHIFQASMWREYFLQLHAQGAPAMVSRTFVLELWPAALIVAFHQLWYGTGIVLTLYGHLLMLKTAVGVLHPVAGLRSLAMAAHGDRSFRVAGAVLVAMGGLCAVRATGVLG